jgi:hypothetical protein
MGSYTTASGDYSMAMGEFSTASGITSTAMGYNSSASGNYSTAMGDFTSAHSSNETAIGRYNTLYTPASTTDWVTSDRLFVIGNGTSNSARSNALTVLKNGNVGIGTTSPANALSVLGDIGLRDAKRFIGTTTDHDLALRTSNIERMTISSVGNVGIGTTNPANALSVLGDIGLRDAKRFIGTTTEHDLAFRTNNIERMIISSAGNVGIGTTNPANALSVVGDIGLREAKRFIGTTTDHDLAFRTNNIERMTISSAGNVGIGTTSPNKSLTVAGDMEIGTSHGNYRHLRIGGGNSSGFLYGAFAGLGDGFNIGYNYYHNNTTDIIPNSAGGTSRIRMGYGRIEVLTNSSVARPTAGVTIANGATSWSSTSDMRLKTNVKTLTNVLDNLSDLRGVTFNWKEGNQDEQIGFIAQEIEKVYPQVISKNENDHLEVRYTELIPVLLQAIKELKAENDLLKQENEGVNARLERLEKIFEISEKFYK